MYTSAGCLEYHQPGITFINVLSLEVWGFHCSMISFPKLYERWLVVINSKQDNSLHIPLKLSQVSYLRVFFSGTYLF